MQILTAENRMIYYKSDDLLDYFAVRSRANVRRRQSR